MLFFQLPAGARIRVAVVVWSILALWACYWALTLIYNSPNNPIRIACERLILPFEYLIYQKWSFFAPPGSADSNVYYVFYDHDYVVATMRCFEVTDVLLAKKRQRRPFNELQRMLDYVVLGAAGGVGELVVEELRIIASRKDSANRDEETRASIGDLLDPYKSDYPMLQTLVRYAEWVARSNSVVITPTIMCAIIVTTEELPKFSQREKLLDPTYRGDESIDYTIGPFNVADFTMRSKRQ